MTFKALPELNDQGFTFIELLVAVVILAVITVSIMGLLPQAYRQITNGGRISVINHLGYEKLDELKSLGYSHADLTAGDHPLPANYRLTDADFIGYSVKWTVADDAPTPGVKTVLVEVGYELYQTNGTLIPKNQQPFQLREVFSTYVTQ